MAGEDFNKLSGTKYLLELAQALWTDNPDYAAEQDELDRLIEAARPKPKPRIRVAEKSLEEITVAAETATAGAAEAPPPPPWRPIASESECTGRLAGYGRRARAICFDMIHAAARGPLLVVVPNGDEFERPFAISKYEISISDWSKYCILSGTCQAIKDRGTEATNRSRASACNGPGSTRPGSASAPARPTASRPGRNGNMPPMPMANSRAGTSTAGSRPAAN